MTSNNFLCNYLDVDDFRIITEQLISSKKVYTEDIPAFNTRNKSKLETIISQIQSNYFGEELYKHFTAKAAILFYLIIKDHPFINGNKRIAIVALYEFIERNVSELYLSEEVLSNDLFEMAIKTAKSLPFEMENILKYLEEKIESFIVAY